jgi:hypothetical protein
MSFVGDHKDRPYTGHVQLKAARTTGLKRGVLSVSQCAWPTFCVGTVASRV